MVYYAGLRADEPNLLRAQTRVCFLLLLMLAPALEALRDHFGDASSYLRSRYCYFLVIACFLALAGSRLSACRKGRNNKKL